MPGRFAVDFGTSNTIVAVWDEETEQGVPLHLREFGQISEQDGERISVIPSLIHYSQDGGRLIGQQVIGRNLAFDQLRTFRWMKRYIANRSPVKRKIDGEDISFGDAGGGFLSAVLARAAEEIECGDEEIALAVPVEAFEHYDDWLTGVAAKSGRSRFRIIDEPSAAALGYGADIQPNDVYLIFDFGGGTLDVSIVRIEDGEDVPGGRRCVVLGKAGEEIGGATIDAWLYAEVLRMNGRDQHDDDVREVSNILLSECERAKIRMSGHKRADITVMNPHTGAVLSAEFTRGRFEDILDEHEAYNQIDHTIRRAMNSARDRGYTEDTIKAVLMIGGGSLIPSVQQTLRRIFGVDRIRLNRPLDAVARGAAAFVGGVEIFNHIQHDYSIRSLDVENNRYDYIVLVPRGTLYPADAPVGGHVVIAAYDGQSKLGICIYEESDIIGKCARGREHQELVFDTSGAARLMKPDSDENERRNRFEMNWYNPTFLVADPPAQKGERRFEVTFSVDGNKRLLITARDLRTNRVTHRNYPVVKLA